MTWITTIAPDQARGRLKQSYQRLGGRPDNILQAHSLRPATLDGHLALYRAVLHHPDNRLDKALAEAIGVLVSHINGCDYCVAHHRLGMTRALGNDDCAQRWCQALIKGDQSQVFDLRQQAALNYAEALTRSPAAIDAGQVRALRQHGWDDGEILEINQVAAYFAYANRTVLGLGVALEVEPVNPDPGPAAEDD